MEIEMTNKLDLQPEEAILWRYLISDEVEPAFLEKFLSQGPWVSRRISAVIWMAAICFLLWGLYTTPSEKLGSALLFYFSILIVVSAVNWFLEKSNLGRKHNLDNRRNIFQNCILTNKRLVMFNHNSNHVYEFQADDIRAASMDYENGGYALRVTPISERKDSVLIGIADFQKAVNIIQNRLLNHPLSRA